MGALEETEQSSKRKMFLQSNAADITLREQADNAAKFREGFSDRKEYKTMQTAQKIQDSEWPQETQDGEWLAGRQKKQKPKELEEMEIEIRDY